MLRLSAAMLLVLTCFGVPSVSLAEEPAAASTPTDQPSASPTEHDCEHRKKEQATS